MSNRRTLIGPLIQGFFTEHLLLHKNSSPQTIASYRDTFRLLLQYYQSHLKVEPVALHIDDMSVESIIDFLEHLEKDRHNCVRTRNARLTAIRSFYRWVALCDPQSVDLATRVLAIPTKRTDHRIITSLSKKEIDALLAVPDLKQWQGRRDHALFSTLYNTGARVSEIIKLQKAHVKFGDVSYVNLFGKGRKERTVPIWPNTAKNLKRWIAELDESTPILFPSARGNSLTRNGVSFLLGRLVERALKKCPSLSGKKISPHCVRHTTGTHLLKAGVDISVIALWLGHESLESTHIYVEADLAMKEKAMQKLPPSGDNMPRYKPKDSVMSFLSSL